MAAVQHRTSLLIALTWVLAGCPQNGPRAPAEDTAVQTCPASGLMVTGSADEIVPPDSVAKLVDKLRQQRGIAIDHTTVPDANHFFVDKMTEMEAEVTAYLDKALAPKSDAAATS